MELKCVDRFGDEHIAQCLNYLRATDRTVCLLVNFQKPKVEWKRIVYGQCFAMSSSNPKITTGISAMAT